VVVTPVEKLLLPVTVSCAAFEITPAARIASAAALLLVSARLLPAASTLLCRSILAAPEFSATFVPSVTGRCRSGCRWS
jgi:hypothetical protein